MFFGKKREKTNPKIQNRIKFEKVSLLVLENGGVHLELNTKTRILKYKNVISPGNGDSHFPEGYFDEGISTIAPNGMNQIACIFDRLFQRRYPESNLDELPPGATRDAYMRIQSKGSILYYTNTHVSESDFQVESEPVAEEYVILVQLLKQYCNFPQFIPVDKPMKNSSEVLEHLSDHLTPNDSSKIIGYRYNATGVFGYVFYKEKRKLCSVSSVVVPSPPVMMFGFGNKWKSEFENCTIVPGITRYVYDCNTGRRIYKIVYRENGKYEINNSVIAYCNAERYAFFCDNQLIAQISKATEKCDFVPQSTEYDIEPYFDVFAQNGIDENLLMLIFSFPMLQFAF